MQRQELDKLESDFAGTLRVDQPADGEQVKARQGLHTYRFKNSAFKTHQVCEQNTPHFSGRSEPFDKPIF